MLCGNAVGLCTYYHIPFVASSVQENCKIVPENNWSFTICNQRNNHYLNFVRKTEIWRDFYCQANNYHIDRCTTTMYISDLLNRIATLGIFQFNSIKVSPRLRQPRSILKISPLTFIDFMVGAACTKGQIIFNSNQSSSFLITTTQFLGLIMKLFWPPLDFFSSNLIPGWYEAAQ